MKALNALIVLIDLAVAGSNVDITDHVAITVPSSEPPFAKIMDPALVSVSLEFQFWPTYAGIATGQPNHYVNELLGNLGQRTGKTPAVRVGGTSENTAYVDTSFQLWNSSQLKEVYGPFTNRANTTIGKDWYVLAGNLPAGTELTFGLNLYNQSEVASQAKMLAEAFQGSRAHLTKDVNLKFIQVGNEPNLYFPTAAEYVAHWIPLVQTALRNIEMGHKGQPTLWIGSEYIFDEGFQLTGTLEAGVLDNHELSQANHILEEHQYSGAMNLGAIPGGPSPGSLMNKSSIRGNLSTVYNGMLNAHSYKKTYYLGEANTYAEEAIFGLSNTGESAIWAVDYMLKAASIGVERVYLHSTPNRLFSVFQPGWGFTNGTGIDRPHIMPIYNGLLVVGEMIGKTGKAKVAEIENPNVAVASYGVWENSELIRMVLINSNTFDQNDTIRSALNITLSGGFMGGCTTIKRLNVPHTTATEGILWAGQSFETDNGAPSGKVVETTLEDTSITIAASEVVMLQFSSQCRSKGSGLR